MTGGINVKGDAGQVVAGDVREGARASAHGNVLNVNFGQGDKVETISRRQKTAIWIRAKRIAARTGQKPVEIYGTLIFPYHEISRIEDLPAARYWRVVKELDARIEQLSRPLRVAPPTPVTPGPQPSPQQPSSPPAKAGGRRWGRYVFLALILGIGWHYLPAGALDAARAKLSAFAAPAALADPSPSGQADACLYDGKVHSIGSIVVMAGVRSICQAGEKGADAEWKALKPARRRPAAPKPPEAVPVE